ncbi:hypothetical protein B9S64_07575 [Streptomyces sp. SM18]|nr:hypothetical protein B9S64_07575 [Streptomyces sp. SM18]
MPSLTVVVSSDTDICFSPGLYGLCLPTVQPPRPRIHSGPRAYVSPSCSHTAPAGGCVTSTLSASPGRRAAGYDR